MTEPFSREPHEPAGAADPFGPAPDEDYTPPPVTRRSLTLGISVLATTLLVAGLAVMPAPYVVRSPGPTQDTLGAQNDQDLIQIEGAETYDSTGELLLTTVSVAGGPGYPANLVQVVEGWASTSRSVRPVEETFPRDVTQEQSEQESQQEMLSSQETATVAALTELGYEVPATLTIQGAAKDTGAEGVVETGDVITTVNGKDVVTYQDLIDELATVTPGDDVVLGVERGGESKDLTITTQEAGGKAILGVFIDPAFDLPVDVSIQIEDIGGPSAGTMFALGIIDRLTPEDEANGTVIAGTGTMSVEGNVGPIGGIQQKLYGAQRDGATWFLAPESNCDEVVGNVPEGLNVVKVSTLEEARDAMVAIGAGEGEGLPTCS
ncbi:MULTISPECIES: YlbL family protein [Oerskovia]|uniref:endopeptidase La n=2 Tax=Oerskovia TaxID=162491 RepID=A0ABW1XCA6_9CELL|nr:MULTISPECIES: S16 family serine protease [Oerskovia]MBM7496662.1 PDZ domain-containing protein [Oerskovia paurometabola]